MTKPHAPLFGFTASGKLGHSLVFANRMGVNTVREYVSPANPKTEGQLSQRDIYQAAVEAWNALTPAEKAVYNHDARSLTMTGYNLFLQRYIAHKAFQPNAFQHDAFQ